MKKIFFIIGILLLTTNTAKAVWSVDFLGAGTDAPNNTVIFDGVTGLTQAGAYNFGYKTAEDLNSKASIEYFASYQTQNICAIGLPIFWGWDTQASVNHLGLIQLDVYDLGANSNTDPTDGTLVNTIHEAGIMDIPIDGAPYYNERLALLRLDATSCQPLIPGHWYSFVLQRYGADQTYWASNPPTGDESTISIAGTGAGTCSNALLKSYRWNDFSNAWIDNCAAVGDPLIALYGAITGNVPIPVLTDDELDDINTGIFDPTDGVLGSLSDKFPVAYVAQIYELAQNMESTSTTASITPISITLGYNDTLKRPTTTIAVIDDHTIYNMLPATFWATLKSLWAAGIYLGLLFLIINRIQSYRHGGEETPN